MPGQKYGIDLWPFQDIKGKKHVQKYSKSMLSCSSIVKNMWVCITVDVNNEKL